MYVQRLTLTHTNACAKIFVPLAGGKGQKDLNSTLFGVRRWIRLDRRLWAGYYTSLFVYTDSALFVN